MTSIFGPKATISIFPLRAEKVDAWIDGHVASRGMREIRRLSGVWHAMQDGTCVVFTAFQESNFAGHIVLLYESAYTPFRRAGFPEIVDLWVQPTHRQKGVGRLLLQAACDAAFARGAPGIGLGVGLTASFGAAHRLYASSGFLPDGTGAWVNGVPIQDGDKVIMNDDVAMMWVKKR